MFMIIFNKY